MQRPAGTLLSAAIGEEPQATQCLNFVLPGAGRRRRNPAGGRPPSLRRRATRRVYLAACFYPLLSTPLHDDIVAPNCADANQSTLARGGVSEWTPTNTGAPFHAPFTASDGSHHATFAEAFATNLPFGDDRGGKYAKLQHEGSSHDRVFAQVPDRKEVLDVNGSSVNALTTRLTGALIGANFCLINSAGGLAGGQQACTLDGVVIDWGWSTGVGPAYATDMGSNS